MDALYLQYSNIVTGLLCRALPWAGISTYGNSVSILSLWNYCIPVSSKLKFLSMRLEICSNGIKKAEKKNSESAKIFKAPLKGYITGATAQKRKHYSITFYSHLSSIWTIFKDISKGRPQIIIQGIYNISD